VADLSDPKTLEAFIVLCKKHGILQARVGEVELHFSYVPKFDPKKALELAESLAGASMSGEQALFGSAPQFASQEQVETMLAQMRGEGS
jgi:hypothetical protein